MRTLKTRVRHFIGRCLLRQALKLLDRRSAEWLGSAQGLRERRLYERYWAYCQISGALYDRDGRRLSTGRRALPIDKWREEMHWMGKKFASRTVLQVSNQ